MEVNKARFYNIVYNTTLDDHQRYNIGTYKEKKLHIMLKRYFEDDPEYHEVPVNGYIADICRDGVITEIETSGFTGLGPKLSAYLPEYSVNLVYPAPAKKYVSWIDPETSEISDRRISPKKVGVYDAIFELIRILPYVGHENLTVTVMLLEIDEYKLLDGWSRDRKKGASRYERIPVDLYDIIELSTPADFEKYIPEVCTNEFTVKEFSKAAKIREERARAVIKVFEKLSLIEKKGKRGRSYVYSRI